MNFFSIVPTLVGHLASGWHLPSSFGWECALQQTKIDVSPLNEQIPSLSVCRHSYHCMENVYEDSRSWFSGENHQEKITSPPVVNTMAFEMQNDNITIKTQTQKRDASTAQQFKPHDCLYTYIVNFVYTLCNKALLIVRSMVSSMMVMLTVEKGT